MAAPEAHGNSQPIGRGAVIVSLVVAAAGVLLCCAGVTPTDRPTDQARVISVSPAPMVQPMAADMPSASAHPVQTGEVSAPLKANSKACAVSPWTGRDAGMGHDLSAESTVRGVDLREVAARLQSGDARARVAAMLLVQPLAGNAAAEAAWAAELLAKAGNSNDVVALRWAERACQFVFDQAACASALAERRTQLEPENARHWLDLAEAAPQQAESAWSGLSRARYWRDQPDVLASTVMLAGSGATSNPLLEHVLAQAMAIEGRPSRPSPDILRMRCTLDTPRRLGDAACERLARLLIETGDSESALGLGIDLAKGAGWGEERLRSVEARFAAIAEQAAALEAPQTLAGCTAGTTRQRYLQISVDRGTRQAFRDTSTPSAQ